MNRKPPYTCWTCIVRFWDFEAQKQHFKSEWHAYNLKRNSEKLPSITLEDYERECLVAIHCKICREYFSSRKQYENHSNSKTHKNNINILKSKGENESDVESDDSDEWLFKPKDRRRNRCLFCNYLSESWVRNLRHMAEDHSFFIPDLDYCCDIRMLLTQLGTKVISRNMCIWCCDKEQFETGIQAQVHMRNEGHCKMLHEGAILLEYEEFYDYSISYPDSKNADPIEDVEPSLLDNDDYQVVLPSGDVIGYQTLKRNYDYRQSRNQNQYFTASASVRRKLNKVIRMYRALGWKRSDKETIAKKARDILYMYRFQSKYCETTVQSSKPVNNPVHNKSTVQSSKTTSHSTRNQL